MTTTAVHTNHPCFGMTSRKTVGRLHLPVAPRSMAKTRFSNGTRPKSAMLPDEAVNWMEAIIGEGRSVGVVGITGPGDPMATPEATLRTLRLVRQRHPDMSLCLTTLGIGLADYASELAEIGLSHVTVLVDAVDFETAEKLYAWVRPGRKTLPRKEGIRELLNQQARAVAALGKAGITVKINTTVYPGYNAGHVERIAIVMAGLGADIMAVVPYCSTEEGNELPARPGRELLATVREQAARHIKLMPAWSECGEAVVGLDAPESGNSSAPVLPKPSEGRPNVAVVSSGGMEVDLHLGHAVKVLIYGPREDGLNCLLEVRDAPEPGSGASRWKALADMLSDCFILLAASAGQRPREVLSSRGLTVFITDGEIDGTVDALYGGKKKGKK